MTIELEIDRLAFQLEGVFRSASEKLLIVLSCKRNYEVERNAGPRLQTVRKKAGFWLNLVSCVGSSCASQDLLVIVFREFGKNLIHLFWPQLGRLLGQSRRQEELFVVYTTKMRRIAWQPNLRSAKVISLLNKAFNCISPRSSLNLWKKVEQLLFTTGDCLLRGLTSRQVSF
jgi:hypothetical protein